MENQIRLNIYYQALNDLVIAKTNTAINAAGDFLMCVILQLHAHAHIRMPLLTPLESKKIRDYVHNLLTRRWAPLKDNIILYTIRSGLQILITGDCGPLELSPSILGRLDDNMNVFKPAILPYHLNPTEHFWWKQTS